jgi:hypothetical protein
MFTLSRTRTVIAISCVTVAVVTACDRRPEVTSCADDLHGVWLAPSGRWALIDYGKKLEAFTLFDDAVPEGAPRAITLERTDKLAGEVKRRYVRGADACEARAPFHVTKCEANELQVVLADPQPPITFAPCSWGAAADSRVERWRRD